VLRLAHLPLLLSAVLTLCAAGPVPAQGPETAASVGPLVPRLGLPSGAVIRVAPVGGTRVEGPVLRATDGALVLWVAGREQTIPLHVGDSVWVRGRATKRGAITGGVLGLALTGAVVALFYSTCENGTDDPCTGQEGFVPLGILAGGGGVFVGAALGSLFPRWHRRQP
jgi:hypothetical protein